MSRIRTPTGSFSPQQFADVSMRRRFIQAVLDRQNEISPTHFVAPGFYIESPASPWITVNELLLKDTKAETGGRLYATVCGSYDGIVRRDSQYGLIYGRSAAELGVEGALVLISPLSARSAGPTKLLRILQFFEALQDGGLNVVACRQPAFGLGCLAFGVGGFDSGVASSEAFRFPCPYPTPAATERAT